MVFQCFMPSCSIKIEQSTLAVFGQEVLSCDHAVATSSCFSNPLASVPCEPPKCKTLAVMQVSGGTQFFNAVNQLRVVGRWMRLITLPKKSSIAKA